MLQLPHHPGPPTLAELKAVLAAAGEEDTGWEAKGPGVDASGIAKAVAGLANRDGGVLVLGAESAAGGWNVTGLEPRRDGEPGRWISDAVSDAIRPVPRIEAKIISVDATGRWAAVVMVDPLQRDLAVHTSGRVYRRDHGRTSPVQDGASLTELVLRRAGVGLPARLDAALPPDELADEVIIAARNNELALLPSLLSRMRTNAVRAIQFEPDSQPAVDQITGVAAALASVANDTSLLLAAIREHQRLFDEVRQLESPPNARYDLTLFRALRPNVLALGGLLVRLGRWEAARQLVDYSAPELGGARRSWLLFMAHRQHQASPMRNPEASRHSVRAARDTTLRLRALHPDQADEHVALDSVLEFDLIANLIELERGQRDGYASEIWPDSALFAASGITGLVERLLTDDVLRAEVAPGASALEVASLLIRFDAAASKMHPEAQFWDGSFTAESRRVLTTIGATGD